MKNKRLQAFTFVEIVLTLAIVALTGGAIFTVLYIAFTLSGKNTATNMAHQEAQITIRRFVQQIYSAASVPKLVDVNLNDVSGNGPAAGISFKVNEGGPYQVFTASSGAISQMTITAGSGGVTPAAGMHLMLPTLNFEGIIQSVGGSSSAQSIGFATVSGESNLSLPADVTSCSPNYPAYYIKRSAFVVAASAGGGYELRYYPTILDSTVSSATPAYTVLTTGITTPTPFSIPTDTKFIQIDLGAQNNGTSNRNYFGSNLKISTQIPVKYQLTKYQ